MHTYLLTDLFSYSIAIAGVMALFKFKNSPSEFRPFILLIWFGLLNEVISTVMDYVVVCNAVNSNIYVLAEYFFILWFFKNMETASVKAFYIMLAAGMMVWCLDNLVLHTLQTTNSLFRIFSGLVIVFLSVEYLNLLFFSRVHHLACNSGFLICTAFIIFFSYKAVFEVYFVLRHFWSDAFYINIFHVLVYVNIFTNLIFAFAMLCLPKKNKFILVYS